MNEQTPAQTADSLRSQLLTMFQEARPILQKYGEYAQKAGALGLEYHLARFKEQLTSATVQELTLVATLEAHETPATLDRILSQIPATVTIRSIIFDRVNAKFHLFT